MVHLTKRPATTGREKAIKARYKSSSKKSTSKKDYTKAGKGSAGGKTSQTSAGKKFVEKKLGLVKTTATKLKGKDKKMYGEEASQATNEYLVSIGEATRGRKLDDGTYGYMLTSKGKEMKYGKSGGAMGSGDPSSIMGSTQISEEMFLKQKKIQGITLGVLSLFVPMFGGTLLRAAAADAAQAKYKEYGGTGGQFQSYQTGGKKFPDEKKVSEDKQIATSTIVGGTGVTGEKVSTTGKTLNLAAHLMGKSAKIRTFI